MSPVITTYKHDYIDPRVMGLNFSAASANAAPKTVCNCLPEKDADAEMAAALNERCGATEEGLGQSEWTGIAPMGILIKPRIILDQYQTDDVEENPCFNEKPNKFLKNLSNTYPTLYEDLRKMNKDDLSKVTQVDRLKTTYQVDYCGNAEFPSGSYGDDLMPADQIEAELKDPCCEQSVFKDTSVKVNNKPFKHIRRTNVECSHCPIKKDDHYHCTKTEYTAKVNQIGHLIMQERLHDHSKCKYKCVHAIKHSLLK